MLKITRLFNIPASRKNNSNDKIIGFSINDNINKLFN